MNKRLLAPVLFTLFLDMAAFGLLIPLVALYGRHYEASAFTLAMLSSTYSFFQFFCAPLWGALSDKIGRRPVLLFTIAGSTLGFIVFGLANSLELLFASRIISGIFGGNISVAQAFIADCTPEDKRAAGMGLAGAMIGLGFVMGPPLGGITSFYMGMQAPGLIAALLSLGNLALALVWLVEPERLPRAPRRKAGVSGLLSGLGGNKSNSAVKGALSCLLVVLFISTFAFCLMEHSFALYLQEVLQVPTREAGFKTGMVLMWIGVLGVIVQGGLIRQLTKRFSEVALLKTGLLLLGVAMLLFPLAQDERVFFIAGTVIALGGGLANPTLQSLISKQASADSQGLLLGFAQGISSLARILGPLAGISMLGVLSALPFMVASLLYALLFALLLFARTKVNASTGVSSATNDIESNAVAA